MPGIEWATRVHYAAGPSEITRVGGEETARWTHGMMAKMPFPYTTSSGRVATGVEMVTRVRTEAGDGEWQPCQMTVVGRFYLAHILSQTLEH
jgi:hypothetical protein